MVMSSLFLLVNQRLFQGKGKTRGTQELCKWAGEEGREGRGKKGLRIRRKELYRSQKVQTLSSCFRCVKCGVRTLGLILAPMKPVAG